RCRSAPPDRALEPPPDSSLRAKSIGPCSLLRRRTNSKDFQIAWRLSSNPPVAAQRRTLFPFDELAGRTENIASGRTDQADWTLGRTIVDEISQHRDRRNPTL